MAKVTLKNLTKVFDSGVVAVKNVSFDIEDREFLVLVGPSGCGKTTILRMIAGLEEISSGEIIIGEKIVNDVSPQDRDIAMVFQNYALYPHMTSYQNMEFGLKLKNYSKYYIAERIKNASMMLTIEELMDRKPEAMSGGQKQRVAVGRAIVREPKVFLFDEPLSNLDAKVRMDVRAELSKLHKKLNATMIYVTHDQIEAMTLGERIVVLKDGVVQQIADPMTIYNNPVNVFVAGFIGAPPMNFLNGRINQDNNKIYFLLNNQKLLLKNAGISQIKDYLNKEVILGIRPEDIEIKNYSARNIEENVLSSKLDVAELLGYEIILHFLIDNNGTANRGLSITVKTDAHYSLKLHEQYELIINVDKIHLFDKSTEKIIL